MRRLVLETEMEDHTKQRLFWPWIQGYNCNAILSHAALQ